MEGVALPPALTSLTLSVSSPRLSVGRNATLVASASAAIGAQVAFSATTSDAAIAAVTGLGPTFSVVAISPGTARVSVTASATGAGVAATAQTTDVLITVVPALGVGFGDEQFSNLASGTFLRGSLNGASWEQPVRAISISAFRMQVTEVTQSQWRQVMSATARANPSAWSECGDSCPVEQVSWNDVQEFLLRLNAIDPGKGYRLPTEAEWEYAARAGTVSDFNVVGAPVQDLGWIDLNAAGSTKPVGQKTPNTWGLFDMHGNVWEWVSDWWDPSYYASSATTNPTGPAAPPAAVGPLRVIRGGSWNFGPNFARSAARLDYAPSNRAHNVGFRLARSQ